MILWAERLLGRITGSLESRGSVRESAIRAVGSTLMHTAVGDNRTLALASWRAVLAFILRALDTERELLAASDVQQLQGLCERMDSDAFLPLRSEELTSDAGARIRQYCEIVNLVTEEAVAAGVASIKGLRSAAGAGYYGRYVSIHGNQGMLQFNAPLWAKRRATPLWLRIDGARRESHLANALSVLSLEQPPRLILDGDHFYVPLNIPTGAEKREVVAVVSEQVQEVASLLAAHQSRS